MVFSHLGMFPPSQLPDSINVLLIRNENVWDSNRFWKITFSDPSFLKNLLLNQIYADSNSSAVSCYSLKNGHYYVVETERYSYEFLSFFLLIFRGTSIAVTEQGYGLYSCFNNHLAVDTNLNYFADRSDHYFSKDYSRAELFPAILFGDIYSSDPIQATAYIAGSTEPTLLNNLRLFVSYSPVQYIHTVFRKFQPEPAFCPSLPSTASCECVPTDTVEYDKLASDYRVYYNPTACTNCSALCEVYAPISDFQVSPREETGKTSPTMDSDGTPLLERDPFKSFSYWFHSSVHSRALFGWMPRLRVTSGQQYKLYQ